MTGPYYRQPTTSVGLQATTVVSLQHSLTVQLPE